MMAGRAVRLAIQFAHRNSGSSRSTTCLLFNSPSSSSPVFGSSSIVGQNFMKRTASTTTGFTHLKPIEFESQRTERGREAGREGERENISLGLAAGVSFFFFALAEEAEGEEKKYTKEDSAQVIQQADELYKAKKMKEYYFLLEGYNKYVKDDVETAWRHARSAYEYAQTEPEGPLRKQLIYQSREIAQNSLKIDENHHQTQKWNGISTSAVTDYEGITSKIQLSFVVKDHFEKVIQLAPTDPYGYFLLGKWQWTFSEMPWYTRKVASTFFATPPSATHEEALGSFLKAEETQPGFYLDNQLMVGKCFKALGRGGEAREWLERVAKADPQYFNDHGVIKEAGEILKSL